MGWALQYLSEAIYLEYNNPIDNNQTFNDKLVFDMTDELIKAVVIIDSIQSEYALKVTESNSLKLMETVSKLKMNMLLLDKVHTADLIELADQQMRAELKEALFWAVQKWVGLVASILIGGLLIFKLTQWSLRKKAISQSVKEATEHFKNHFKN